MQFLSFDWFRGNARASTDETTRLSTTILYQQLNVIEIRKKGL